MVDDRYAIASHRLAAYHARAATRRHGILAMTQGAAADGRHEPSYVRHDASADGVGED